MLAINLEPRQSHQKNLKNLFVLFIFASMQNSVATLDEDWIDGIDEMIYRSDRLVLVPERRSPSPLLHFGKRQASSSANFSSHRPTSLSRFFREKEGGETQAGRNVSTGEEANDS